MLKTIITVFVGVCLVSGQVIAAEKCSDGAVVDQLLEQYVCSNTFICHAFGIKDYKELKTLSDEEIASRYNNSDVAKQLGALKKRYSTASGFTNYKDKLNVNALLGARTLIKSTSANAIDYNAAAKKYTCEAKFTFGENELEAIANYIGFTGLISASEDSKKISASLLANEGDKALQVIAASMPRMVAKVKECYATTIPFVVQNVDAGVSSSSVSSVSFDGTSILSHGKGACP